MSRRMMIEFLASFGESGRELCDGAEGQRFESSRARYKTRQIVSISRVFAPRTQDQGSRLGSSCAILAEFLASSW